MLHYVDGVSVSVFYINPGKSDSKRSHIQNTENMKTLACHVNPPSFVRSLRHFGIAENLRPGDENLRHLTATSRFKKLRVFLAINNENAT